MASDLQPDIVLLDVRLPDALGIDAVPSILAARPQTAVVLMSTGDYRRAVAKCGARAFIPKAELTGQALRAAVAVGT